MGFYGACLPGRLPGELEVIEMLRMQIGHIYVYEVIMTPDRVVVLSEHEKVIAWKKVDGLGKFIQQAACLRLGWAKLPDFEVIYIYDKADNNFGYAVNITDTSLSEWGYAPFEPEV
jgi:hypothetical protein